MTDCHPDSESYSSAAATDDKASRCYHQTVTQVRYLRTLLKRIAPGLQTPTGKDGLRQ